MNLKETYGILNVFSDFLSLITISTCFILKVPQIINVVKLKNANGINLIGLLMELTSYTIMFSYNYRNGYALMSYMEYPIILVQEIILIYFVLYYKNQMNFVSGIGAVNYFAITLAFLIGLLPRELLTFLVPLCTPVGASSKVVQLFEMFRTKNAESISVLTWFISAFTNFTRIFTIFLDSADLTLLLNFTVNTFLSAGIMCTAYYYQMPNTRFDDSLKKAH